LNFPLRSAHGNRQVADVGLIPKSVLEIGCASLMGQAYSTKLLRLLALQRGQIRRHFAVGKMVEVCRAQATA
jgi:hypothetical protein